MNTERPTALVTGASSGIGLEFARRLAASGSDLVLVARGEEHLRGVAAELESEHGVACEVLAADLGEQLALAAVEARLADPGRPVAMLVNSAGIGSYADFLDASVETADAMVRLNVLAVVRLSHAALGPMVARGSGAVVNISSTAGAQPMPHNAMYSASKTFVTSFTQSIAEEVASTGVRVMALLPGYTHTDFHERAGVDPGGVPSLMWMSAADVVAAAFNDLERGRVVCVPGMVNKLIAGAAGTMPDVLMRKVAARQAGNFD